MPNKITKLYSLIVTTSEYVGNFERELPMWLCGIPNEHGNYRYDEEAYNEWAAQNPQLAEAFIDISDYRPYDEYGINPAGLDPHNTNALEIYLDRYAIEDEEWFANFIVALKCRIGVDKIYYRKVKDYSKYPEEATIIVPIKILKLEVRTYTTEESNNLIA